MFEVKAIDKFSAAHRLAGYEGNCERIHGHNYKVEVCVSSSELNPMGLVIDFRLVKKLLGGILKDMDHQYLNELGAFKEQNPSAENIARYIYNRLTKGIPPPVKLSSVRVWENDDCCATYRKEGN
ncbi:MAG: 6-carboxytetrahydropterin synthase QueD [Thermodesulfobacteriota bacterium]|nr:6-carboxytetrahydropterin synthase QueD [Thermodesulfobacteriota bacterium]